MEAFSLEAVLSLADQGFTSGLDAASGAFSAFADTVLRFTGDVIETGLGFDRAMGSVQAVLGQQEGTVENMNKLRGFALDQAKDSIFTAEQTADAYYYMGMAGWKSQQMMAGLPGIMSLAAASGEDLGRVSDIVTDSITAFGLTADDVQGYVDILAQTVTNSNTNVSQLGEAFKYAAPLAGALGVDVDDTAVAFGLMASAGIKGSQAGTTMRSVFQRLAADTNNARSTLENMGIEIFDSNGKMRDFGEIIDDSRAKFAELNDEEKSNVAYTVAGKTGMSGWLAVMNATDDEVQQLRGSIADATGAAQTMADVKLDNLPGSIDRFNSAYDILKQTIYDDQKGPFKEVVDWATGALNDISDAIGKDGITGGIDMLASKIDELAENESVQKLLESLGGLIGTLFDGVIDKIIPKLTEAAPKLVSALFSGFGGSGSGTTTTLLKGVGNLFGLDGGVPFLGINLRPEPTPDPKVYEESLTKMVDNTKEAAVNYGGVELPMSILPEIDPEQLGKNIEYAIQNGGVDVEVGDGFIIDVESAKRLKEDLENNVFVAAGTDGSATAAVNMEGIMAQSGTIVAEDLEAKIGNAGNDGGATAGVNLETTMSQSSDTVADYLADAVGSAGTKSGNNFGSNFQSALNAQSFSVNVNANVVGIPGGATIQKNARSMASGHIFTRPTIFGFADGKYQEAGDAGPEAVVGVSSLYRMIYGAVTDAMPDAVNSASDLVRNTDMMQKVSVEIIPDFDEDMLDSQIDGKQSTVDFSPAFDESALSSQINGHSATVEFTPNFNSDMLQQQIGEVKAGIGSFGDFSRDMTAMKDNRIEEGIGVVVNTVNSIQNMIGETIQNSQVNQGVEVVGNVVTTIQQMINQAVNAVLSAQEVVVNTYRSPRDIHVNMQLDGANVGRVTFPYIEAERQRIGVSLAK